MGRRKIVWLGSPGMRVWVSLTLMGCATAAGPLAVQRVNVPPRVDGAGQDDAWRQTAWETGFHRLSEPDTPPTTRTRFKMVHDGVRLYALVRAEEPRVGDLRLVSGNTRDHIGLWKDDSVQVQLDPGGDGFGYYQFIVNWQGTVFDARAEDDNRGIGTFVLRTEWDADVAAAAEVNEAFWLAEVSIPFAELGLREDLPTEWGVNVCRSRYAGGGSEHSACVALHPDRGFGQPSRFRRLTLADFDPRPFQWVIGAPATTVSRAEDGFVCRATTTIQNQTGEFRIATVRARLGGAEVVRELALKHLQEGNLSFDIPFRKQGTGRLALVLARRVKPGTMLARRDVTVTLEYRPLQVIIREPAYRNCIFASQRVDTVVADILTEPAYADQPVTVTFEGESVSPVAKSFPRAGLSRRVEFPVPNLPVGPYRLTASIPGVPPAAGDIRKLPHLAGEVWLDARGNTYVDGVPFLPFGWFSAPADRAPHMTALHTYGLWSRTEDIRAVLDRAGEAGKKLILTPFQGEKRWDDPIKDEARRGAFTPAHEARVRYVVNSVKDHPAILGWYMADEPEGRRHSVEWYKAAYALLRDIDPHHPCIMLNYGIRGMQSFHEACDILMPDCYPVFRIDGTTRKPMRALTEWTRAARALRPAWLVPQVFDWDGTAPVTSPGRPPTFDEVRNQIWQALGAGARGILMYSYRSDCRTSCALRLGPDYVAREALALQGAFFGDELHHALSVRTQPPDKHFVSTLFRFGSDLLLVAVNTAYEARSARFRVAVPVPGEQLYVVGEPRSVSLSGGSFSDDFEPIGVRLYTTRAGVAQQFDIAAMRRRIAESERARLKAGNLVGLGGLPRHRLKAIWESAPRDQPLIQVSSRRMYASNRSREWDILYLLDGLSEDVLHHSWVPRGHDKTPWLEIALPEAGPVGRVKVYTPVFRGQAKVKGFRVFLRGRDGALEQVGEVQGNGRHAAEARFPPRLACAIRIVPTAFETQLEGCAETGLITEVEVYAE